MGRTSEERSSCQLWAAVRRQGRRRCRARAIDELGQAGGVSARRGSPVLGSTLRQKVIR